MSDHNIACACAWCQMHVARVDITAGGFEERTYVGKGTTVADVHAELARLAARVAEMELDREGRIRSSDYDKARIEELEAEVAVLSGTACAEEQAEGNGPCGACRTCRNKRITELEAENERLRKCVEAGDHYINSIYSITSNTGLLHAEWSEKIDYYAARAEVGK